MRRWIKGTFAINDIVGFSPRCCQVASTSKAKIINVDVNEIIRSGCW